MNKDILSKYIDLFVQNSKLDPEVFQKEYQERLELVTYYQSYTRDKITSMPPEDIHQYISKLWAMQIWGNKHYLVDKLISENGLDNFRNHLAQLVWGEKDISNRWDTFRREIKGMGPAMISEILCKTHPANFILWNHRANVGLNYLEVANLPRYDYQITGKVYNYLCSVGHEISKELQNAGLRDTTLLAVDYFIYQIYIKKPETISLDPKPPETSNFIHNDIRDKLSDIGQWLGLTTTVEQKVAKGAQVDVTWESTIGNMGRVIYVFEVQTKGSMDSLMLNLLKSLNNPAVQGIVAVSDKEQLEIIKNHAMGVRDLRDKLKYWDYENVLKVHESLEFVNANINELHLVPEGF
jgi:hypothetical protein